MLCIWWRKDRNSATNWHQLKCKKKLEMYVTEVLLVKFALNVTFLYMSVYSKTIFFLIRYHCLHKLDMRHSFGLITL